MLFVDIVRHKTTPMSFGVVPHGANRYRTAFGIACLLFGLSGAVGAQPACDEQRRIDLAIGAVRAGDKMAGKADLRAQLLPEITDTAIALTCAEAGCPQSPDIRFYRVVPSAYVYEQGKMVSEEILLDGKLEWIVAVVQSGWRTFLFGGPSDKTGGFNAFVRATGLRPGNVSQAYSFFRLYLTVVYGPRFIESNLVSDEMELQSVALKDFRDRLSKKYARQHFELWWRGIPESVKRKLETIRVDKRDRSFDVHYWFYDSGELGVGNATINPDGIVEMGEDKILGGKRAETRLSVESSPLTLARPSRNSGAR